MPAIANVFTPETAVLGGLTLGAAAAGRLALNGRVLGISGVVGGLARGKIDPPRVAFTAGLLGAGALLLPLSPSASASASASPLQALSSTSFSAARAVAAGALVGAGSALGGGCTSGHGICGNARLSKRSMAFTGAMMVAGGVSAAASGARAAVGIVSSSSAAASSAFSIVPYAPPAAGEVAAGARLFAVAVGTLAALAAAGRRQKQEHEQRRQRDNNSSSNALELAAEAATGALFSLGLAVSGMLRPSKVVAFLTPFSRGGGWDPSLGLVMAGALAVATPAFQRVLRGRKESGGSDDKAPACAPSFELPTKTAVDARLLAGAALFGLGWGLGGICPGPGIVAAAAAGGAGALYWIWSAAFLAAHALTTKAVVA